MIYTVTFNPSLDYYVQVNNLKNGVVNRTASERLLVGGKGINVSLALEELGEKTCALGFLAGFTGETIKSKLKSTNLNFDFIKVEGLTRINVKIKSSTETDINGTGAEVKKTDIQKLVKKLKTNVNTGDFVAICGSVPSNLDEYTYANIMKRLREKQGVNFIIDACGKLLLETLRYKPFLIKPNVYEMCELFSLSSVPDIDGIFACARKLRDLGARNVIVSMGSSGAAMVTETDQSLYVRAARGELVNSVGAGDSMIAGFLHEYLNSKNYFSALNFATAAGSACAFTMDLPTRAQIEYVESLML